MKTAMQELQEWMTENHYKVTFAFLDQLEYCKQKEKEQKNQTIRDAFEHCWNHPNWKGEYDIKDMNDYLKNL
jgi:hypothetical protein